MKIKTFGHATLEVLINEEPILSFENWENNIAHLKNVLLYLNMNNVNCSMRDVKYQQVIGDDELFRFTIFWDTDNVPDIKKVLDQFKTGDIKHYVRTDYFKIRIVGKIKYKDYSDTDLCCMPMLGWYTEGV